MEIPVIIQGEVGDKSTSVGTNKLGESVHYYNVKFLDREKCENMSVGVPKDVFDKCERNKIVRLGGYFGGYKTKYLRIESYIGEVK